MGTSNSFGGSKVWLATLADAARIADAGPAADVSSAFSHAFGAALGRGDSAGRVYRVSDLLAGSRSSSGSSASGQGRGDGASPPFTRDAARGALVFAAVEAMEAGDIASLADLGIDLDSLAGLTGTALFAELAMLILGAPSHPDDLALSQAVLATLSTIPAGATLSDRIAQFVSALAWQRAAVQLSADKNWRSRARGAVKAFESKVKGWIRARVSSMAETLTNRSPQQVANYASDLAARACREFKES